MSRIRALASKICLAIAVPAILLFLFEISFRLAEIGYPTDFLLSAKHGGQEAWIDNQAYGYRFFPPPLTRTPPPIMVPATKAPGEYRVVILGESAAMGEPEPAFGPARMLNKMMDSSMTGKVVRVINAAMTAINSHVITEVARELPKLKPDLVILYIGNNEVVGPYGPGTILNRYADSYWLARISVLATRLRIVGIMRGLYFRLFDDGQTAWQGMEMFTGQRIQEHDPRILKASDHFQRNLDRIIRSAEAVGAQVLLSTVAVNLNDQAPLDGTAYDASQSRGKLKEVRDRDQLRFRADGEINETIRSVAASNGQILFADPEAFFDYMDLPDRDLFIDHVHFTARGSYEVARCWMDALELVPGQLFNSVLPVLGWSAISELEISEVMIKRIARPPFNGTQDFRTKMDRWARVRSAAAEKIQDPAAPGILTDLEHSIAADLDDPYYLQLAYTAAKVEGNTERTSHYLTELSRAWPHRLEVRGWQALEAISINPETDVWTILSNNSPKAGLIVGEILVGISESLWKEGKKKEALRVIQTAVDHYPEVKRYRLARALRLANLGMHAEAEAEFSALNGEYPQDMSVREEYAGFLTMQGNFPAAKALMAQHQNSPSIQAQLKWIQLLVIAGDLDEALAYISKLSADHPESADVWTLAAGIRARSGDHADAISDLEYSLKLEPWREMNWIKLAGLYESAGNLPAAIKALKSSRPYTRNSAMLEQEIRRLEGL